MTALNQKQKERASKAGQYLDVAARSMRILKSVSWDTELRNKFLRDKALPRPIYNPIDTLIARDAIKSARDFIDGDHVVFNWLSRLADTLDRTTALIDTRGTKDFFEHSKALYGEPNKLMMDGKTRVIDLARHMDDTLDGLDFSKLVDEGYEAELTSEAFAKKLKPRLRRHFGRKAPELIISENLSAKAVAGARRIRIRADASFNNRDIEQLLQHEAFVHSATALNGKLQKQFPILGRAHAGTTQIQEGLAVFAEMISGAMDPERFRRLSDRVIAIQQAIDGADFMEVFEFYNERLGDPDQAYENTRRIFRGGVLTGQAPFTKDGVYLNGLLRVHNFIRSIVKLGRADLIRVLFVGKMDIEDLPALAELAHQNMIRNPKYLPPWVKDQRFLVSYMAYSSFLNQVKMPGFQSYYEQALKDVPVMWDF